MKNISRLLAIVILSSGLVAAETLERPPLPPELKDAADAIRKAVETGEITHEQARAKHEALIRDFREKLAEENREDLQPENPLAKERQILQAAKEGSISQEEAREKLESLREEMARSGDRKRPQRQKKPEIAEEVKAQVDAVKESHASIHETIKANRPAKPERPELTEELKAKVDGLHAKRKEMHEAQKELHQNLKEATEEERKELITAFKEANKEKHEEIKAQAKEVKEEIRSLIETEATRTSDL